MSKVDAHQSGGVAIMVGLSLPPTLTNPMRLR